MSFSHGAVAQALIGIGDGQQGGIKGGGNRNQSAEALGKGIF